METLLDSTDVLLEGFANTLEVLVISGAGALVLGIVLAAFRVSPVPVLQRAGAGYVLVFRNTPLIVLFVLTYSGLPELGFQLGFVTKASLALGLYTAAFICEAVRSGVNAVPVGQAEAARAVGMDFRQTLGSIVLPQALRAVIPPLASVLIALTKNTSVVAVFGIADATFRMRGLINDNPGALYWLFAGTAAGYIAIVAVISGVAATVERRVAVAR